MDLLYFLILFIHILSGYVALSSGAVVMLAKKGNKSHRILGRIFFYSMLGVSISAFALALYKDIPFLFYIGIFVFYQNYAGYQSVRNKSLKPNGMDITVLALATVNAFMMILSLHLVLLIFGFINIFLAISDLWIYYNLYLNKKLRKLTWLSRHLGMMTGAYIGAFTAFLVVNSQLFQAYWFVWLLPTFLFVPLILYWTWKYTRKPFLERKERI